MADYDSSLPVRTEADVDERLQSKIIDYTTPTQGMVVDTDGNAHAEVHGNNPAGGDIELRLSELGSASVDGEYNATDNTDPSQVGLVGMSRNASPADSQQTLRLTGITNGSGDVRALDVAMRDENGEPFSQTNPVPVVDVGSEGDEINDYQTDSDVASGASVDHDYTVTALKTLYLSQIEVSGSSKLKMEVKIETGVATGTFNTKWVMFNSTANTNCSLIIKEFPAIAAGVRVRVTLTNRDNQPQNLYSTISGHEV